MISSVQSGAALTIEPTSEYVLAPDVIFVAVADGSARLLNMAGRFHAVPKIGARMIEETLRNGAAGAASLIADSYGIARQQVEEDLAVFLCDLENQGLLSRQNNRRSRSGSLGLVRALLRPSLRATHRFLKSPESKARTLLGLARLSFGLFGWTRTVAVWQEAHAQLPMRQAGEQDAEVLRTLDRMVRTAVASHLVAVACKERALCSWSLARAAGLSATLFVGINLFPIAAHCWCEAGTQLLGDDRERCDAFTPVARW